MLKVKHPLKFEMVLWCPQFEWRAQEIYRNIGLSLGAISVGWIGWRLDAWTTCSLEETLFCFSRAMVCHLAWILFVFVMSYRRTAPWNLKWKANPPEMVKTSSNRLKHSGKDTRGNCYEQLPKHWWPRPISRHGVFTCIHLVNTNHSRWCYGWLARFLPVSFCWHIGCNGLWTSWQGKWSWGCLNMHSFKYIQIWECWYVNDLFPWIPRNTLLV